MTSEDIKEISFECSNCDAIGEIPFSTLQRQHQKSHVKVLVNDLPSGISKNGVSNLFLTVGNPTEINFFPDKNSASVTFESMREAELAVRDLNEKPPYNLTVTILPSKTVNKVETENEKTWDFSEKENLEPKTDTSKKEPDIEDSKKKEELLKQMKDVLDNIGYDPSLQMRQRKLDFETDVECVSLGRGYTYMGDFDRFVGGLQKLKISSENSTVDDHMNYSCDNCNALTTKTCSKCSTSFCSKVCLKQSDVDHKNDCRTIKYKKKLKPRISETVELESGCTVVMTAYILMSIVFVRRTDRLWENKFTKLCNDVAAEALKGKALKKPPKMDDLVLALYYQDLCYYRGKIASVDNDEVHVFFIDFGNTQLTKIEDVKYCPDSLKVKPAYAKEVFLKGVERKSSVDSVDYFNKLTAEKTALVLMFTDTKDEVILVDKESKTVVNEVVKKLAMPSWEKCPLISSKLGEIYYLKSLKQQSLEIGKTFNPIISHFDEKEFKQSEVFWVFDPETDVFCHMISEMYLGVQYYCESLENDFYLPRDNELCLAKEGGEWHRCVNLKSQKTICYLFFLDDGHSSFVHTSNIRKIVDEFLEAPAQAICCTLPDNPKLKNDKEIQEKVIKYLSESAGQTIANVKVLKLMGDAFCLSLPEVNNILAPTS